MSTLRKVDINGFRGLEVKIELKKVNIVVGENGTGKTSFLEAIFLSTLFQSDMNDTDIGTSFTYIMSSRGDILSAFSTLSDSEIILDNNRVNFKKKDPYNLEVYVNKEKVAEIDVKKASLEGLSGPLLLQKMGVKGAESLASLRRGWIAPL
ncbi:MAG: AAA family ATPase [Saccharolobus sp.]|uniref:ATP-binding protein n=1 Tax=Saccharolobus TaxID=2100760 RepID=UPI001F0F2A67|nr:AAA family ATPase [Saccharolobus shibatae]MCH4816850.1 AAA family ATPase [Saccharolobus shibatae]